jgi:hypothetical protein
VYAKHMKQTGAAAAIALAVMAAGCGEYLRDSRSPVRVVISRLAAASGAEPEDVGDTLSSDVLTLVRVTPVGSTDEIGVPTVFGDNGQVTMVLVLKDPGTPGIAAEPSQLNQVTFTRYRVQYRRTDGRNTPGVDVPFSFDSAVTFTVPPTDAVTASFLLVRQTAKKEAPLLALVSNGVLISAIADVTFYGRDLAGNDVSATGSIGITFGNFGDPD